MNCRVDWEIENKRLLAYSQSYWMRHKLIQKFMTEKKMSFLKPKNDIVNQRTACEILHFQ